jgi:hypothetical protein
MMPALFFRFRYRSPGDSILTHQQTWNRLSTGTSAAGYSDISTHALSSWEARMTAGSIFAF